MKVGLLLIVVGWLCYWSKPECERRGNECPPVEQPAPTSEAPP